MHEIILECGTKGTKDERKMSEKHDRKIGVDDLSSPLFATIICRFQPVPLIAGASLGRLVRGIMQSFWQLGSGHSVGQTPATHSASHQVHSFCPFGMYAKFLKRP